MCEFSFQKIARDEKQQHEGELCNKLLLQAM